MQPACAGPGSLTALLVGSQQDSVGERSKLERRGAWLLASRKPQASSRVKVCGEPPNSASNCAARLPMGGHERHPEDAAPAIAHASPPHPRRHHRLLERVQRPGHAGCLRRRRRPGRRRERHLHQGHRVPGAPSGHRARELCDGLLHGRWLHLPGEGRGRRRLPRRRLQLQGRAHHGPGRYRLQRPRREAVSGPSRSVRRVGRRNEAGWDRLRDRSRFVPRRRQRVALHRDGRVLRVRDVRRGCVHDGLHHRRDGMWHGRAAPGVQERRVAGRRRALRRPGLLERRVRRVLYSGCTVVRRPDDARDL
jgi:hypothetical protein